MKTPTHVLTSALAALLCLLASCSSNNCPLENNVLCNYYFYDSDGNAITYTDAITVKTLLPGQKTVYTYRKLGYNTVTLDQPDTTYLEQGYSETESVVRRDTVLVNKSSSRSFIQLPMSYYHSADTLVFSYASISLDDTVIVSHRSYAHVELPECGTHYFHQLLDIRATDAAIDHIEIANPLVNYMGNENIRIYFNGVAE